MPRAQCLIVVAAVDGVPHDNDLLPQVLSNMPPGMRVIFVVLHQRDVNEHIRTISLQVPAPHVVGVLDPLWLVGEIERVRKEMQNSCLLMG